MPVRNLQRKRAASPPYFPFDQVVSNQQLWDLLTDGNLPGLGKNALIYAQSTDLYSMHERAADVIFETRST